MSDDYMHDAKARSFLIRQTLRMLVQPSEDRKYNGQLLEPIEFLRSISDRLLLMPLDEFEDQVNLCRSRVDCSRDGGIKSHRKREVSASTSIQGVARRRHLGSMSKMSATP